MKSKDKLGMSVGVSVGKSKNRLLYQKGNDLLFEINMNEYVYITNNKEYFFHTQEPITKVTSSDSISKSKVKGKIKPILTELIAESPNFIWYIPAFSYYDKKTGLMVSTDFDHDLKEYTKLLPFKEYIGICKDNLIDKLNECQVTSLTPTNRWLSDQYKFNLKIAKNAGKLTSIIYYLLNGVELSKNIISNLLKYTDLFYIKKLDELIDAAPRMDRDTLVYRGIAVIPKNLDLNRLKSTFTSTSLFREKADNFSVKSGTLCEMVIKKGTRSLLMLFFPSVFSDESEVLLPRGLNYTIISKRMEKKQTIIRLEVSE